MDKIPNSVYIASRTRHAARWRQLRANGFHIISTWIDEAGPGESACMKDLWGRCVREASMASRLIVYAEPEDLLKGALVEVGAALAHGVPVFVVGTSPSVSSWTNHYLVTICDSIEEALVAP